MYKCSVCIMFLIKVTFLLEVGTYIGIIYKKYNIYVVKYMHIYLEVKKGRIDRILICVIMLTN